MRIITGCLLAAILRDFFVPEKSGNSRGVFIKTGEFLKKILFYNFALTFTQTADKPNELYI